MKMTLNEAKEIIAAVNARNAAEAAREDCGRDYRSLHACLCTYDEWGVEDACEDEATHLYIACESWSDGEDAESIICEFVGHVDSLEFGDGGRDDKSLLIELRR